MAAFQKFARGEARDNLQRQGKTKLIEIMEIEHRGHTSYD